MNQSFNDLIEELLDSQNTILQVKVLVKGNKLDVHIKNPLYYWTAENYDRFLNILFKTHPFHIDMRENILRRIAQNDEWYDEVNRFRNKNQ
jgi:hypothetical protein